MILVDTNGFKKVYELDNNKEILSDISVCYLHLGDLDKSRYYNELAEENINAQYNLGIINLINGNFKQGWNGYEIGLSNNARILIFEPFELSTANLKSSMIKFTT